MSSTTSPINRLIDELVVDVSRIFNQEFTTRINKQNTEIQRDSKRLAGLIFQPVQTSTIGYRTAKAFLQSRGASEEAASAFALMAINIAKLTGKSVMAILRETESSGIGFSDENYRLLNRISDRIYQIGNFQQIDNCLSFNSNIKFFYRDCKPFAPFFVSAPLTSASVGVLYQYNIETDDINYNETLTITSGSLPSWLTLTDNGDGTAVLTGTPASGDTGSFSITLTVTDSTNLVAIQSFTITSVQPNQPPQFDSEPIIDAIEDISYSYFIETSDPDVGDTLTITSDLTLPSWLTLTDNGDGTALLEGTPTSGDVGTYNIQLRVEDQLGAFATQTFTLEVAPALIG